MTRTYALMPVTPATHAEVKAALEAAGCFDNVEFAVEGRPQRLNMNGIALVPNTTTVDDVYAGPVRNAQVVLSNLTPEQRVEAMAAFCRHCGTDVLPCHCMNDE